MQETSMMQRAKPVEARRVFQRGSYGQRRILLVLRVTG